MSYEYFLPSLKCNEIYNKEYYSLTSLMGWYTLKIFFNLIYANNNVWILIKFNIFFYV